MDFQLKKFQSQWKPNFFVTFLKEFSEIYSKATTNLLYYTLQFYAMQTNAKNLNRIVINMGFICLFSIMLDRLKVILHISIEHD